MPLNIVGAKVFPWAFIIELKLKNKNIKGNPKKLIRKYILLYLAKSPVAPIHPTIYGLKK